MRVSVVDFKSALALFEAEFIDTMKTKLNKFLVGAMIAASGKQIDTYLSQFVGADGMIESDDIKSIIDAGLKHSGGEIEFPISFGVLSSIGATPFVTTIRKADIDKFFEQTLPAVARPVVQEVHNG